MTFELSVAAEYASDPKADTRFFALAREKGGPVVVESAKTLSELHHNPILDEFAAHYDREQGLFAQTAAARGEEP